MKTTYLQPATFVIPIVLPTLMQSGSPQDEDPKIYQAQTNVQW